MIQILQDWFRRKDKSTFEQYVEAAIVVLPIAFLIRTVIFGLYVVPSGSMEHTMLVGERFIADKLTPFFMPIERGEVVALNDPTYAYSQNYVVNWFQRYVWGPSNWTKRVIGIPGDQLRGVIEDGRPVVYIKKSSSSGDSWEKLEIAQVNELPLIYLWTRAKPTSQDMYLGNYGIDIRTFDPSVAYNQQPYYTIDPDLIIGKLGQNAVFPDAVYDDQLQCYLSMPYTPLANGDDVFDVQLGANEYWLMGDNRKGSRDSRDWGKCNGSLIHGRIRWRFFSVQYAKPWSLFIFDESWVVIDILLHPISFWQRVRWSRLFGTV